MQRIALIKLIPDQTVRVWGKIILPSMRVLLSSKLTWKCGHPWESLPISRYITIYLLLITEVGGGLNSF